MVPAMLPPPRTRRWLLLLLLAVVAAPAAGQVVLVHKVPAGGAATALGASDNATLLVAAMPDGLFTVQAGTPAGKKSLPDLTVSALAPDGSRIFAGTRGEEVIAMDDRGVQQWANQVGSPVTSLSPTWDLRVLYTAGEVAGVLGADGKETAKRSLSGLRTGSLSPGATMALVATEGAVLALDPATLETRWQVPLAGVAEVKAWDGGGAALGSDGSLYRLDDSGRFLQIRALPGPGRLAVSTDGQRIAAAGGNEIVLFGPNLQKTAGQGLANPLALAFTPEGNFLAVAAKDQNLYLFGLFPDRYPSQPVSVESRPPGAAITVDTAYRGVTPAVLPIERGTHRIELAYPGYETNRSTLEVSAGGEKVEAVLNASASAPSAALAGQAGGERDGTGGVLLILLLAGGAVAFLVLRRRKARAPGAPAPAPAPPPVPAAPPPPPQPPPGPDIPPGTSVIVKERNPGYAYDLFRALAASGAPGLAVTRRDPRRVREEVPGAEAYWLSSMPGERNLRPVDLELLLSAAEDHFSRAEGAAVLLEGVEYLQLHRGFTPVLKLVTRLQERASSMKGRLLVAVGTGTLDQRETALLKGEGRAREMEEPPGRRPPPAGVAAGAVHLLLARSPEGAYRRLKEWASGGRKTLVVSRSSPEETRQRFGLGPETRVVWLSTSKGADRVDPSDLEMLLKMVRDFAEEGEDRALLLEGVDHIAAIASFGAVQKFLGHLVDLCVARRAAALVPLDPYALEPGKLAHLGRDLAVIEERGR